MIDQGWLTLIATIVGWGWMGGYVAYRFGKFDATLNNGLTKKVDEVGAKIEKLSPICAARGEVLAVLAERQDEMGRRIDAIE